MYTIKKAPEDFKVFESSTINPSKSGLYAYFRLLKKNYTTIRAVQRIAGFLNIPLKRIGYAGNKDKTAITSQTISIKEVRDNALEKFVDDNIDIKFLGRGDQPVNLGDLTGNRFEIIVRDAEKPPKRISQIINYFDEQRFSKSNADVGLAIAKGDFKKAVELIGEPELLEHLEDHENDYVGALKRLPFKQQMIYLHALSSLIFNRTAAEYLQCKYKCVVQEYSQGKLAFPQEQIENIKLPIIGFATTYSDPKIKEIVKGILKELGITERSFIIKQMPDLSNEGDERNLVVELKDLDIKQDKDKITVTFELPKGSYATMAIKALFL